MYNSMMAKANSEYIQRCYFEKFGQSSSPIELNSLNSHHFSKYFVDEIETIRSKFPDKVQNIPPVHKTRNYIKNEEILTYIRI